MNYPNKKPLYILAPMDDVTDTVFRQLISNLAAPDLFFTEFVNVDALCSEGRAATLKRLKFTKSERPLILQLWGLKSENFYTVARQVADGSLAAEANSNSDKSLNYAGIDLNFGCPDKNVVRNGACSAFILPENRTVAVEIIQAVKEGLNSGATEVKGQSGAGDSTSLPVSVKTRLGFNEIDYSWHETLLKQKLNMLSIHGRTKKQMSDVPANWRAIEEVRKLRDSLCPTTLIIGNGDVLGREQGEELAKKYNLDGIMIGRGIFKDPFVFAENSNWGNYSASQRKQLYAKHVKLFANTWKNDERRVHTLNKFCKVYIQGFDGAKELREKLMSATNTQELLDLLTN